MKVTCYVPGPISVANSKKKLLPNFNGRTFLLRRFHFSKLLFKAQLLFLIRSELLFETLLLLLIRTDASATPDDAEYRRNEDGHLFCGWCRSFVSEPRQH